jgi:hypothetical protein
MSKIHDLSDPEFGPIKARLARVYLEHKGDLGYCSRTTQRSLPTSMRSLRSCWPRWTGRCVSELLDDEPDQPLDG